MYLVKTPVQRLKTMLIPRERLFRFPRSCEKDPSFLCVPSFDPDRAQRVLGDRGLGCSTAGVFNGPVGYGRVSPILGGTDRLRRLA